MDKQIKIKYPDGHHGYGIEFFGLDHIKYDMEGFSYSNIQYLVNINCPDELSFFFQGGFAIPESSQGWGFIEFWNADQHPDLFLEFVLSLGEKFGIEIS